MKATQPGRAVRFVVQVHSGVGVYPCIGFDMEGGRGLLAFEFAATADNGGIVLLNQLSYAVRTGFYDVADFPDHAVTADRLGTVGVGESGVLAIHHDEQMVGFFVLRTTPA